MLQSHFSTILLMRLGSTKRIEQCYNTRTLSFGCAANWVDYSKTGDKVTGDQLECVFARLKNGDSRMNVKDYTVSLWEITLKPYMTPERIHTICVSFRHF